MASSTMSSSSSSSSYGLLLFVVLAASTFSTGLGFGAEKIHLRFYSVNLTLDTVASLAKSSNPGAFGNLDVLTSPLVESPEVSAKPVGSVQGMVVGTSQADPTLLNSLNFIFTDGEYKGSSLAAYGREVLGMPSEKSIVGGSGHFRMTRGFIESKTYAATATTVTVQFDAFLLVRKH